MSIQTYLSRMPPQPSVFTYRRSFRSLALPHPATAVTRRLVVELAVHVAAEQRVPDLGQHLAGQQVQPRLERVDDLDPVALGVHFHTAAPVARR